MTATVTDLFCGAGGSSVGATLAGAELRLGLNHWDKAIETHNTNFPHADHDCADVSQADPRSYVATDILIASPECTNHSIAKGGRRRKVTAPSLFDDGPAGSDEQERSRATMWDVVRFAEAHRYKAIIVENVVDAFRWGTDDDGALFRAWLNTLAALGYEHDIVWLNSMFAGPVPQSRDRMYVVFWQRGMRRPNLTVRPLAWCPSCEAVVRGRQSFKRADRPKWGRYGTQYVYTCPDCLSIVHPGAVPAAAAIDWNLPADRIGDRPKPLAPATRQRIRNGLERLSREPFAIRLLQGGGPRPLTLPLVTLTTRHDMGMVVPVAGNTYETTPGNRARDAALRPHDTVHATLDRALVVPPEAENTIVVANRANNIPRVAATDPAAPVLTGGTLGIVELQQNGGVRDAQAQPTHTVRAGGQHHGVIVAHYNPGHAKDPGTTPFGPITTRDHHSLVVPYRRGTAKDADTTPCHTMSCVESAGLAVIDDEVIDACRFRMFDLHEIAATMALTTHPDGSEYVVVGNKRERMRMYGNAVTPPAMQLLVGRVLEAMDA